MKRIQSLPGASSINFKPCKTSVSDRHNERSMLDQMNNNIDPALADENRVIRFSDMSLKDYEKMVIADYNEYHREHPSPHKYFDRHKKLTVAGFRRETWKDNMVAVKEGVAVNLPDNSDETLARLKTLAERLEREYGITPLRIFLHADEHRIDPETNEDKYNLHAHMVFGWYDWKTHRPVAINPDQMCRVQDLTAEILDLERGNRTGKHGRKHLDSDTYKKYKDIIAVEDRRKIVAFKEVDCLLPRLREHVDLLGYSEGDEALKSSMSIEDYALLSRYIDDPLSITKEAREWIVEIMHPIAYRKCVDRLEEDVDNLRRITEQVERILAESRKLELGEMDEKISAMHAEEIAHGQELEIGKLVRRKILADTLKEFNTIFQDPKGRRYYMLVMESSQSSDGNINCSCELRKAGRNAGRRLTLILQRDGSVLVEQKDHKLGCMAEKSAIIRMALRYGIIKPAGKNGVIIGSSPTRFWTELDERIARQGVLAVPDDVDRDEIDRDDKNPSQRVYISKV